MYMHIDSCCFRHTWISTYVQVAYIQVYTCMASHPHLLTFTSSHSPHTLTFLHPHLFTSSPHTHLLTPSLFHTLTSSHFYLFTPSSPHPHTFTPLPPHTLNSPHFHLLTLSLSHTLTFSHPYLFTPSQISRITEALLGRVPEEFRPLVRGMLAVEPNVRPDAVQISKVSQHPPPSSRCFFFE